MPTATQHVPLRRNELLTWQGTTGGRTSSRSRSTGRPGRRSISASGPRLLNNLSHRHPSRPARTFREPGDRDRVGSIEEWDLRKRNLFALLAAGVVAALLPIPAAAAPSVTTIATGLDSPRGVAFFHGKLLVGEAGHGGPTCFQIPGLPFEGCAGDSSRISWVNTTTGAHTALVTGLFSVSLGPEGVLGVSGLSVSADRILAQIGSTPSENPGVAIGQQQAGRLISVRANGTWTSFAPIGATDCTYKTKFAEPKQ